ncbi:MAG: CPBP family intramembrane metalloprotease, partial [Xanthomonadales bacterium]|nr:CPBP family intramembrane metalloprotease [Xanthomonadales bacterium]
MANFGKSFIAVAILAIALNVRDITSAAGMKIPPLPIPYGGSGLDNVICIALVVMTAFLLSRPSRIALKTLLGLDWSGFKAP